jgi:hypothetical protein
MFEFQLFHFTAVFNHYNVNIQTKCNCTVHECYLSQQNLNISLWGADDDRKSIYFRLIKSLAVLRAINL